MDITLLNIKPSKRKNKRLMATFKIRDGENNSTIKQVHFGLKDGSTFIDHHNKTKKENWLKRHQYSFKRAKYNFVSPAILSWQILWNKPTLEESIKDYKRKLNYLM